MSFYHGTLAQLVEHRTENPGVPGSIPGGTTYPMFTQVLVVYPKRLFSEYLFTQNTFRYVYTNYTEDCNP